MGRLLDLAFPAACAGCRAEGAVLCAVCLPALYARQGAPPGVPLGLPSAVPLPLLQLEWCAPYAGVVRSALHALKYAGERRLAVPLGAARLRLCATAGHTTADLQFALDSFRELRPTVIGALSVSSP